MGITSVRIPDALKQAVDTLAEREGKTPHAFLLEAIAEKVDAAARRQAFHDEGRAILAELRAGAGTVAFDDMAAWMRARARGESVDPPVAEGSRRDGTTPAD